jgi:group II intron reverse transcriptase/maturase
VRWKNARGGIDGVEPGDLDHRIATVLEKLSRQLEEGTYAPAPLERINVPKFNAAGEWRRLSMPVVIDKIVQQAWVNLVAPVWEKEFLDVSYAYRPGKGGVKAIRRLEHCIGSLKLRWAAVADIDNFFDTLDRRILLAGVEQKISDRRMIDLVDLWLRAGFITGKGDFLDPDEGVAQGAVISPLLSNIYLHPMDRFAVDADMAYVRYSDNFIVMAADRQAAARSRERLQTFLDRPLFSLVTRGTSYKKLKVDAKTGLLDGFSRGKVLETVLHRLSGLIDYRGRKVRGEDIIGAQVRQLADVVQGKKRSYRGFITTY